MGFSICYIASKREPETLARDFGLEIAETVTEHPDAAWWTARIGEDGWSVLWCEDMTFGAGARDRIAELSQQDDVILCEVEEHVMWSSAEYWTKGAAAWKVTHNGGDEGVLDLNTEGALPAVFEEIKSKNFALQAEEEDDSDYGFGCDYGFEIPLDLAAHFINYRHDDGLEPEDVAGFHIVNPPPKPPAPPKTTGFLSRLFGRGA